MPYVNIKVTDEGVTPEQKAELIRRVTDALVEVLGKRPEHTHIVIDEVPLENWGFDRTTAKAFRERQADKRA